MNDIQNPLKLNIILSLVASILGILVVFVPGMVADIGPYQFYCNYFGIILIAGGILFALFYFKRYKAFESFMKSDEEKICWEYDDALYESFIGELNAIQKKASKQNFFILLAIIVVLSVILFIMLGEESKMLAVAFGMFFAVTAVVFVLIAPNSFRLRATNKPYCSIIGVDQAYMMGRYHSWNRARAKVKEHDNGQHVYRVLAINYEAMTVNGKLFREWNALMPNENSETIQIAKGMANKINRRTKEFEGKGKKKDILERLFDKMLGRSDGAKDDKKSKKKDI